MQNRKRILLYIHQSMNTKKFQVYTTIVIMLLYAIVGPFFRPSIDFFWLIIGILAILAMITKNWVDLIMITFVGINMVAHMLMYPTLDDTRHIAQTTAFCALTLLHATLLIGPLTRINKRFSTLFRHRRHVGVAVFLLAFVHANLIIARYYEFNPENIYGVTANFFGSTALLILSVMAFTSTNYFQTKLSAKYYNLLHTGLLIIYSLYILILVSFGYLSLEIWHYIVIMGFIIFWIIVSPWGLPKKLFLRVNAWKQLHYLVYIAYIAVIIHSWTGYFVLAILPMQITYWLLIIIVFSVHFFGWILRFSKRKLYSQTAPPSASA